MREEPAPTSGTRVFRLRLWTTIAALILTLAAASLIGWQLPVAFARSERAANLARLNSQLVGLVDQTNAVSLHQERLRTTIDDVSAQNAILARKIEKQKTDISSLKDDIKRLKEHLAAP